MPEEHRESRVWEWLEHFIQIKELGEIWDLWKKPLWTKAAAMPVTAISALAGWIFDRHHWWVWLITAALLSVAINLFILIRTIKAKRPAVAVPSTVAETPAKEPRTIIIFNDLEAVCTSPLSVGKRGHVLAMLSSSGAGLYGVLAQDQWGSLAWGKVQKRSCSVPFREQGDGYAQTKVKLVAISADGDVTFPDGNTRKAFAAPSSGTPDIRFSIQANVTGPHFVEIAVFAEKATLGSVYVSSEVAAASSEVTANSSGSDPEYTEISRIRITFDVIKGEGMDQSIKLAIEQHLERGLKQERGHGEGMSV